MNCVAGQICHPDLEVDITSVEVVNAALDRITFLIDEALWNAQITAEEIVR